MQSKILMLINKQPQLTKCTLCLFITKARQSKDAAWQNEMGGGEERERAAKTAIWPNEMHRLRLGKMKCIGCSLAK